MRKSLHVATALVVGTITVGTASIAVASRSDDIRIGRPTVTRVHHDEDDDRDDRAQCLGTPSTSTTNPADQGAMSQTVTVTVERTALLRVDRRGRITAAATNTGCRPHVGDRIYVISPSGTYTEVTDVDLDELDWKGSFRSIGQFERQSGRQRLHDH